MSKMVAQVLFLLKSVRFNSKVTFAMPETAQERSGFLNFRWKDLSASVHEQKENDGELSDQF